MAEGKPQNTGATSLATSFSQPAKSFSHITKALGYLAKGFSQRNLRSVWQNSPPRKTVSLRRL